MISLKQIKKYFYVDALDKWCDNSYFSLKGMIEHNDGIYRLEMNKRDSTVGFDIHIYFLERHIFGGLVKTNKEFKKIMKSLHISKKPRYEMGDSITINYTTIVICHKHTRNKILCSVAHQGGRYGAGFLTKTDKQYPYFYVDYIKDLRFSTQEDIDFLWHLIQTNGVLTNQKVLNAKLPKFQMNGRIAKNTII